MQIQFTFTDDKEILTPIHVAAALIEHTTHIDSPALFKWFSPPADIQTFDTADLREIAEHLLVYCKNVESERDNNGSSADT